jgi:hypothetical protein
MNSQNCHYETWFIYYIMPSEVISMAYGINLCRQRYQHQPLKCCDNDLTISRVVQSIGMRVYINTNTAAFQIEFFC